MAPPPKDEVFLAVEQLVKQFPGTRALDRVDLTVRRGEIHALLGENGAGKSTLIRQICGASQPNEGRIMVEGREVYPALAASRRRARRRRRAPAFQSRAADLRLRESVPLGGPAEAGRACSSTGAKPGAARAQLHVARRPRDRSDGRGRASSGPTKPRWSRSPRRSARTPSSSFSTNRPPLCCRRRSPCCSSTCARLAAQGHAFLYVSTASPKCSKSRIA